MILKHHLSWDLSALSLSHWFSLSRGRSVTTSVQYKICHGVSLGGKKSWTEELNIEGIKTNVGMILMNFWPAGESEAGKCFQRKLLSHIFWTAQLHTVCRRMRFCCRKLQCERSLDQGAGMKSTVPTSVMWNLMVGSYFQWNVKLDTFIMNSM